MKWQVKALIICGILIFASGVGLYSLMLAFTESLYVERGSYAYYLLIPSFIKNVPQPQIVGEPEYYSSCGDGPKPMATGVSFYSKDLKSELFDQINRYAVAAGYTPDPDAVITGDYGYRRGSMAFEFKIEAESNGTNSVAAYEIGF